MPEVIGLAGLSCSGKSAVAEILSDFAMTIIDVDALGHLALDQEREKIAGRFGSAIMLESGAVDRRALADIVFSDPAALRDLEAIVHPVMIAWVERAVREFRNREPSPVPFPDRQRLVINAALLFPMGLDRWCDTILYVTAPFAYRFIRALRRDGFHPLRVLRRFSNQRNIKPSVRNTQPSEKAADIITVWNVHGLFALRDQVRDALRLTPADR